MKIKDKNKIKHILFITLSNIGDIILTTPVLSVLKREFPTAAIDVMSGPNGKEVFSGHPFVAKFIPYDKSLGFSSKRRLIKDLKRNKYDLIVDTRNSLFPFLVGSWYRTPLIKKAPAEIKHKKDEHLWKLAALGLNIKDAPFAFYVSEKDESFVNKLLADSKVKNNFIVVSPGAKSHIKRWTKEGFAVLCDELIEKFGLAIVMVGDDKDKNIISEIAALMKNKTIDFSSRLTLRQLGALIKCSKLLITNDSAPMHIGHALGIKVLAIFGPTDPKKYGPLGENDVAVRKELACSPCEVAQCKKNHECMNLISADEVFEAASRMLSK